MREENLRDIFQATNGHCHVCGDELDFDKRGRGGGATGVDDVPAGYWEVDHVAQISRGGARDVANCLPACVACNRLRWHRSGAYVRTTLKLGLIARDKIKSGTETGRDLLQAATIRWPRSTEWPKLGSRRRKSKPIERTTMRGACAYPGCVGGTRTPAGGIRKHTHRAEPRARATRD